VFGYICIKGSLPILHLLLRQPSMATKMISELLASIDDLDLLLVTIVRFSELSF